VRGDLLVAVPACAEYRISVPHSDPIQLEGQESEYVDRAWHQDLIRVFTLGIWMPNDVRYRCKAPATSGSDFPGRKPE